jgi:DNA-binding GntR family transcriptional regulator
MRMAANITNQSGTLRGELVNRIMKDVFSGTIAGGDRLIEQELAAKYGVSRTPIREALGELASLGVIRLKPNHGAVVCPFGPEQIIELYQVRRILEMEATRLAAARIRADALKQIRAQTQALFARKDDSDEWAQSALTLDHELHMLICRNSGSERLAEEIGKYRNLVMGVGEAVGNKLQAHEQNMAEHLEVIDHLLAGRGEDAAIAMGKHIDGGAARAAEYLRQMLGRRTGIQGAATGGCD